MNDDNDTTNPTFEEEGGIREGSNEIVEGNTYDDVAFGGHSNDANNDSDENIDTQEEDGGEEVAVRPSSHYMEGYTPLNFNMNTLAMMGDTDSSESDIDDNNMDGDIFANNGYYHMMGPPPKRLNGVKDHVRFAMPPARDDRDHEEDDISNNTNSSDHQSTHNNNESESVEIPDDFHTLAEQALRGLEVEHLSTLERSMDVNNTINATTYDTPIGNTKSEESTMLFDASFPSFDEKQEKQAGENLQTDGLTVNPKEKDAVASSLEVPTQKLKSVAIPKIHLKEPKGIKSKPMDVNRISKVMKSIRLKSPELATTLDEGASSSLLTAAAHNATESALNAIINSTTASIEQSRQQQQLQLTSHSIIPVGPLAAFRRTTPKAQASSSNLTRSATLSHALLRLWPLICFRRKMRAMGLGVKTQQHHATSIGSTNLIIHIIGADGVECSSEDLVRKSVGSFVRWLGAALSSGALSPSKEMPSQLDRIDSLLMEFSGPNMPSTLVGKDLNLLPERNAHGTGLISAKATFQQREYHEVPTEGAPTLADLVIAFNAGIWGYDSWKPTIASMLGKEVKNVSSGIGKTLFVITAYTVEESEDDADVVAEVVEDTASKRSPANKETGTIARQLWAPEANLFSSRLERKTASAPPGRKYFENGAWQAWLLGL